MNNFYLRTMTREIKEVGDKMTERFIVTQSVSKMMVNNTLDDSMSIHMVYGDGSLANPIDWKNDYNPDKYMLYNINKLTQGFLKKIGDSEIISKKKNNTDNNIIYLSYLGEGEDSKESIYLLISSTIRDIDGIGNIIRLQYPYIFIIILISGGLVSYFMSKRLTMPLKELTTTAERLAQGDYEPYFPKSDLYEINRLSQSLNYAKEQIAEMDQMRISILANISHDLKTPLTVIKSYSEMIRDITGDDKQARNESLEVIISEADRLTDMVNSVMDISKIEMGMGNMELEEFSLTELSEEIVEKFSVLTETEDYKFEIRSDGPGLIMADREMMDKVIRNLVANAINFAGKDKKIIIDIDDRKDSLIYSVIDHGQGISKEDIEKIWVRYYTNHNNYSRYTVGTGLGLHIVKVILEEHGFEYGVESEKGQGSKFFFIFNK